MNTTCKSGLVFQFDHINEDTRSICWWLLTTQHKARQWLWEEQLFPQRFSKKGGLQQRKWSQATSREFSSATRRPPQLLWNAGLKGLPVSLQCACAWLSAKQAERCYVLGLLQVTQSANCVETDCTFARPWHLGRLRHAREPSETRRERNCSVSFFASRRPPGLLSGQRSLIVSLGEAAAAQQRGRGM